MVKQNLVVIFKDEEDGYMWLQIIGTNMVWDLDTDVLIKILELLKVGTASRDSSGKPFHFKKKDLARKEEVIRILEEYIKVQ